MKKADKFDAVLVALVWAAIVGSVALIFLVVALTPFVNTCHT